MTLRRRSSPRAASRALPPFNAYKPCVVGRPPIKPSGHPQLVPLSPLTLSFPLPPPLPLAPRLGMIYKQSEQPQQALECLQAIADQPPPPLTQADVWFLIGEVQETMEPPAPSFAKQAYEHVLRLMQMNQDSKVARVYRQLGWVCHKWSLEPPLIAPIGTHHSVVQPPLMCLLQAVETDPSDAASWHLLAKCLVDHLELDGAYDCLMHAVSLDPSSSEVWATVGAVYLARGQAADAIVACEHATHL